MPLSRRQLLRAIGAAGAATLFAACGGDGGGGDGEAGAGTPGTGGATGLEPVDREAVLEQLGVSAPLDLSVIVPAPFVFAGRPQRIVFGLGTSPTDFRPGLQPRTWLVAVDGEEVVFGPETAAFHDEGLEGLGVYVVTAEVAEPGNYWLVAATDEHAAVGAIEVFDTSGGRIPLVGDPMPKAETPTTDDPMGLADLCTDEPPCGMHDVSLAAAVGQRPVVLTVATPAYCQTQICGPVVDVIESVRAASGRDDVAWIHSEVFRDAGNTPVELIATLGLPSEPWTFFVAADGTVADILQGPTPAELVREALGGI